MARAIKERLRKKVVIVFWEGESEEQYIKYMRQRFHEKFKIMPYDKKGLFSTAQKAFGKKGKYCDIKKEIDEVWFMFDTEPDMKEKWDEYHKIILQLRKMNSYMNVRLLMTKSCIEYYFLLHFEKTAPTIVTVNDKEKIKDRLITKYCKAYKKGDKESIYYIADRYKNAIKNGEWCLKMMEDDVGSMCASDERDKKLFKTEKTFTTVHEAIQYMENTKIS